MAIRLAVLISTKPGLGQLQIDAFKRLAPLVRAEPGCLQYDVHQVVDDPDRFVLLEQWESQSHLDAHSKASHMREAAEASAAFRAGTAELLQITTEPVA